MVMVKLTQLEHDYIGEIANIGGGHATGILSDLLDTQVSLGVPRIKLLNSEFPESALQRMIIVHGLMQGADFNGDLLVSYPHDSAVLLKDALSKRYDINRPDKDLFSDHGRDVIRSYIDALNNFLSLQVQNPMIDYKIETRRFEMERIQQDKTGILITTIFTVKQYGITGIFDLLINPMQVTLLVERIQEKFSMLT